MHMYMIARRSMGNIHRSIEFNAHSRMWTQCGGF